MEELKNVKNEEIVEVEETKKVSAFSKAKTWTKANIKKVAIGATIGVVVLVGGYAIAKKLNGVSVSDELYDDLDDVIDSVDEVTEQ